MEMRSLYMDTRIRFLDFYQLTQPIPRICSFAKHGQSTVVPNSFVPVRRFSRAERSTLVISSRKPAWIAAHSAARNFRKPDPPAGQNSRSLRLITARVKFVNCNKLAEVEFLYKTQDETLTIMIERSQNVFIKVLHQEL